MVVKLERVFLARSAKIAIGAVDFRGPPGVAALAVRVMFLDQPFVGTIHGRGIGTGIQPQRRVSRCIPAHGKRSNPLNGNVKSGASDGT